MSEMRWMWWGLISIRLLKWSRKLISKCDAKRNEQLVIFKEEDGDGWEMVTAGEEWVLRGGWTEIRRLNGCLRTWQKLVVYAFIDFLDSVKISAYGVVWANLGALTTNVAVPSDDDDDDDDDNDDVMSRYSRLLPRCWQERCAGTN